MLKFTVILFLLTCSLIFSCTGCENDLYIIDRFEGEYAVCEDKTGNTLNIHISDIPENAREGSVLANKCGILVTDDKKTDLRRNLTRGILKGLK